MGKQTKQATSQQLVAVLCSAVVVLTIIVGVLLLKPPKLTVVSNFEQCKQAGGTIREIYPEQCVINDTVFTNQAQSLGGAYVGMSEADALAKAKQDNTPARVVERDDESLPVTMDFVFGRHNFHVKDNLVYKVEIEGQASDTN